MIPRTVFSAAHEQFRDQVRRFVVREILPHHAVWEEAGVVPREAWRKAGEAGLLLCNVPEEWGGMGGDFLHSAIVIEEMSRWRHGAGLFTPFRYRGALSAALRNRSAKASLAAGHGAR